MIKVCVIGGGFTAWVTSIALKKNCPSIHLTIVDDPNGAKNIGYGESAPFELVTWIQDMFKVPEEQKDDWYKEWVTKTNTTFKFSFYWKNFADREDPGYYSSFFPVPDYRVMYNNGHAPRNPDWLNPDNNAYRLWDIWYELYYQGRRKMSDYGPNINQLHWHTVDKKLPILGKEFLNETNSTHIDSVELYKWFASRYKDDIDRVISGKIEAVEKYNNGAIKNVITSDGSRIDADFFIDCTGFKRFFANELDLDWQDMEQEIRHDAAVVVANGYTSLEDQEENLYPYTGGYGMDYGWTFSIPLLNRRSYGYVYDSRYIDADQALEELSTLSDPNTRIHSLNLKWTPGWYKEPWTQNVILIGIASGFIDAFDANSIGLQTSQISTLVDFFVKFSENKFIPHGIRQLYNNVTKESFESFTERIRLHFGLATRSTSPYWLRNQEYARDTNIKQEFFDVMNNYKYTPHRKIHNGAYSFTYLDHLQIIPGLIYDLDMRSMLRQSTPEELDLAEMYFDNFSAMNKKRSDVSIKLTDWWRDNGIDLSSKLINKQ